MRILFVCDSFLDSNNGTTITTQRFARELVRRGHEVRVACAVSAERLAELGYVPLEGAEGRGAWQPPQDAAQPDICIYPEPRYHMPIFQPLVDEQGYVIADSDPEVTEAALAWCDIAHFLTPFNLCHYEVEMAKEMGMPATAAFHIQPENLTSSIHLGKCTWFNAFIYRLFRWSLYQHVVHVQCPSQMIAQQLKAHGYTNELHVISNGIADSWTYQRLPKEGALEGHIVVTMVGRYSVEKRQDLVIKAAARSRHKDQILVVLAGQGPQERRLRRLSARLGVEVRFGFLSQDALRRLLAMSDLYVHASDMEAEAMSCMEAFATGLVPIISDSPLSATSQFALDERSIFRAGDAGDLASHLDWWIEHPSQREEMGHAYAKEAERYRVGACVDEFEGMLKMALGEQGTPAGPEGSTDA
jgi:1,2-diacylglycerol 3-alpha-glucosyltransferase